MNVKIHWTEKSENQKIGPIFASTTERATCPDSCPLKGAGCYADGGPQGIHWRHVSSGKRDKGWENFLGAVRKMKAGNLWRHNVSGDLPGENNAISGTLLRQLVAANVGRRGYTYTHKPVLDSQGPEAAANREEIARANRDGFTVNLSANGMRHADKLAALGIAPVTTILPDGVTENTLTPEGRKVVICPAQKRENVNCASCKLCARRDRSVIVGFMPHGQSKRKTAAVAAAN